VHIHPEPLAGAQGSVDVLDLVALVMLVGKPNGVSAQRADDVDG